MKKVKICKVLSIDWDYMIDVKKERAMFFPDGVDNFGMDIKNFIWAQYYANPESKRELDKCGIKEDDYRFLVELVKSLVDNGVKVVVSESHFTMYEMVKNYIDFGGYDKFRIYNLDYHHDLFNEYKKVVDCGNWFSCLINEGLVDKAVWINDKFSQKMPFKFKRKVKVWDGLEKLDKIGFDAVFICKSSSWTPPHLDDRFIGFIDDVGIRDRVVSIGLLEDRMDGLNEIIDVLRKQIEDMNKKK
jgi:hypothetical protein